MKTKMAMRIAARISRREGTITEEHYQVIRKAIRHPIQKKPDGTEVNLMDEIDNHVNNEMGKQGLNINWNSIITWFKAHWLQVIGIILSLINLAIFLDMKPEANNAT